MKQVFLFTVLLAITSLSFSQNSVPNLHETATEKSRWDLNQYVWSHKHYKTGKNDKPVIDFDAIENWMGIGLDEDLSLSPNGKFLAFSIRRSNAPRTLRDSLIIRAIDHTWQKSFPGTSTPGFFTVDSRQYIYQLKDRLYFILLNGDKIESVQDVLSSKAAPGKDWFVYQLKHSEENLVLLNTTTGKEIRFQKALNYNYDRSGKWLVVQLNNESKQLVIHNLSSGEQLHFSGILEYKFDETGTAIVLKMTEKTSGGNLNSLKYVDLLNIKEKSIWSTMDTSLIISDYCLDGSGKQVAFTVQSNATNNSIWYYKHGMDKAITKVDNQTNGMDESLMVQGSPRFTNNGNYILFSLQLKENFIAEPGAVQLDVWSYKDATLQSVQMALKNKPILCKAVIKIESDKVIRLENEFEKITNWKIPGDFVVIWKANDQMYGDRFWKKDYEKGSNWLVSMLDGSRKLLSTKIDDISSDGVLFSPFGKYLVYFDPDQGGNYFSYNLQTGSILNISKGVPRRDLCRDDLFEVPKGKHKIRLNRGIAAWLSEGKGLLVYDAYDIWQLDLSGTKAAINLTNGYGRRQKTFLNLINHDRGSYEEIPILKSDKDTLFLHAYNSDNKYDGFYRKVLSKAGDPEQLYMGPYFFQTSAMALGQFNLDKSIRPLKAKDSNTWIVKRQSALDAPNYFVTHDFKTFDRLTDIQPQKSYNWLTAQLHSFKQLDGTISQGILYKPENFDPTKRYPLIISFYFQKSDQLNQYPTPEHIDCPAVYSNPAWFVSHGYLLFVPDIYFNVEKGWGPSTVNTMNGAVKYLGTLPYVDRNRVGAAGHSNSGRFGYYLLTHSKYFAAMCIGAGTTDLISRAFATDYWVGPYPDASRLIWAENVDGGLGELWKNKSKWIDHTAILQADRVTSPLLIVHNMGDGKLTEPTELLTALRRLEKKAWWLQYDQGDHTLNLQRDKKDLTIRYTQFFDHYLKGAPAPSWMTQGIPFKLKGVESRYELEDAGSCDLPGKTECPVCNKTKKVNHVIKK